MSCKTWNSNKIQYDIVGNLSTMNHFQIMVLRKGPISLRHTILFDANFQSHSIQAPLSAFAYLIRVAQITSARSSSHFNLAYTLKGMAPTPHTVMLRS